MVYWTTINKITFWSKANNPRMRAYSHA